MSKFKNVVANFNGVHYPINSLKEFTKCLNLIEKLEVENDQLINENKPFNSYNLNIAFIEKFWIKCDSEDNFVFYYVDGSRYFHNKKDTINVFIDFIES